MKKQLLFLALACIAAVMASAQVLIVKDHDGNIVNGTTYVENGDGLGTDSASFTVEIGDTSLTSADVTVTRTELTVCESTKNFFCWGLCYNPFDAGAQPVVTTSGGENLIMEPDSVYSNFHAYHVPNGATGDASYRFKWTVKGTTDSVVVNVQFKVAGTCGLDGVKEMQNVVRVTPNPAQHFIQIASGNVIRKAQVIDVTGKVVVNTTNASRINIQHLESGIYLLKFQDENDAWSVTRFIKK